jgi:hypothetical protein
MSSNDFESEAARKNYRAPYSHDHPIPTIQKYRAHREELKGQEQRAEDAQHTPEDDSRTKRAFDAVKSIVKNEDHQDAEGNPYPTENLNVQREDGGLPGEHDSNIPNIPTGEAENGPTNGDDSRSTDGDHKKKDGGKGQSATEKSHGRTDPKQKRKDMKHNKRDDGGREVTDPVTHLPLVIRDSTDKDLRRAPENEPEGKVRKTATGLSSNSKTSSQLSLEREDAQDGYDGMQKTFPPPKFEDVKAELMKQYQLTVTIGLVIISTLSALVLFLVVLMTRRSGSVDSRDKTGLSKLSLAGIGAIIATIAGTVAVSIFALQGWLGRKVDTIWEDEVWDAARVDEIKTQKSANRLPESVAWMNSLFASVWPLINPDLFASLADMVEDVMQASLPKIIRMVSVDDIGQGSESIRILGIRWLPTGAADQSVDEDGNLKRASDKEANDRAAPGEGELEDNEENEKETSDDPDTKKDKAKEKAAEEEQQAMREGMEAEQGDFVNMELAFAYRARSSGKSIKSKAKNAHLYLKFYLPGGIFVPVWVELRGLIGTMRLRLQLTPDPPFFSLCTLTFVGQPKANLSCVPLSKHLPNMMDVPLISSFVQTSIDAALADYVAPKSLTLDLKDMLVGDDFKKDTVARGVIVIFIKLAKGFKEGDGGIGPMKGSSDSYVTCSWGKFGKTVSSTRVIEDDQSPIWDEWAYILVTPEELNAEEKLRLQLWDSDKYTADDDLGRVEVELKELMQSSKTKNTMSDREDRFMGQEPGEKMPGSLIWSVGYYEKTRITEEQISQQSEDDKIKSKKDLKTSVSESAERKLREAKEHDESKEINQQKAQDYRELENAMICSSPPDPNYPSGVLSIQIHNITGLQVESLQKEDKEGKPQREDDAEDSDELPSSYCTIILNHAKLYTTRTKPKNAKPFFNAGTERFLRDWRTAEVMVTIRDSRERELDPLLGIVYLPLAKIFEKRSQIMDSFPLVGGVGFGRARISMVFRSLELQLPRELLGWDYGTLEISSPVRVKGQLPDNLAGHRIKIRSNLGRAKLTANNGEWHPKRDRKSAFLAVRNRYAMPLVVEFRKNSIGPDSTPAFAVFWLKDLPDEEKKTIALQVWKGGKDRIKIATTRSKYQGKDEGEQPYGEIEVTMRFWRGLSGYHKNFAQKSKGADMRNVMEALDTVNDEIHGSVSNSGSDSDSDSDTDSSTSSHEASKRQQKLQPHKNNEDTDPECDTVSKSKNPVKVLKNLKREIMKGDNDQSDGERGPMNQLRDYSSHHKQLHRKHRGVMQWRAARTGAWAVDKARRLKGEVKGVFEHGEKEPGIETEI